MGDLKRISAWVDEETKKAFFRLAKSQDHTESSLLGLLIGKILARNPGAEDDDQAPCSAESEVMVDRVTVRFPPPEWQELKVRSAGRGLKPSPYLRNLFRTHASQAPYFTDAEVDELREANHQLASIGRNVNQIAKALNTSLDDSDRAKAFEYEQMKILIDAHRETVKALIRANLKSWGISE